jgi:HK97 family phage prohead protease
MSRVELAMNGDTLGDECRQAMRFLDAHPRCACGARSTVLKRFDGRQTAVCDRCDARQEATPALRPQTGICGHVQGYAVLFDLDLPLRAGHRERIVPEAFRKAIERRTPAIELRLNHHLGALASTADGSLELCRDGAGLWYEGQLPNTTEGRRILRLVRAGQILGVSPGWTGERDRWNAARTVRTLEEINMLVEISLVSADSGKHPAWPNTWCMEAGAGARARRHATIRLAIDRVAEGR